ncbi:hypothetical protein TNCV_2794511 [Trichonephila clavipes]|nr:hypothetical protein TNCV_2794511 [Trichonephila clavipes]
MSIGLISGARIVGAFLTKVVEVCRAQGVQYRRFLPRTLKPEIFYPLNQQLLNCDPRTLGVHSASLGNPRSLSSNVEISLFYRLKGLVEKLKDVAS